MPNTATKSRTELFIRARYAMGMSQRELGDALRVSQRTVARQESGQSHVYDHQLHEIAALLHPRDPALARELAQAGGKTLEELGIVAPVPPPPPPQPPPARVQAPPAAPLAPPPPVVPTHMLVDAIVYAAAEALEAVARDGAGPGALRGARAAVVAAFVRTRDLGLDAHEVAEALAPRVRVATGPQQAQRPAEAGKEGAARKKTAGEKKLRGDRRR
jgi:DNA-binding XRE family transcriptional regulator